MQGVLHKTLIIRLSSVGDVVLSSPLVRALHGRYPDCQIDFLVKAEYADLVRFNPHVAHVIQFPGGGTLRDLVRLRRTVISSRYDLIIDIHDSIRSRYLSAGAVKVTRVNKRKFARTLLVNFKLDVYDRWGGAPDVAARYLETVTPWGIQDDGGGPEIFSPPMSPRRLKGSSAQSTSGPARCASASVRAPGTGTRCGRGSGLRNRRDNWRNSTGFPSFSSAGRTRGRCAGQSRQPSTGRIPARAS